MDLYPRIDAILGQGPGFRLGWPLSRTTCRSVRPGSQRRRGTSRGISAIVRPFGVMAEATQVGGSDGLDETARFIAEALGETEAKPVSQITKVVEVLGREASLELLAEVERIEAAGGMPLPDGGRRRSPGGVFFQLARPRLPRDDRYRIFRPQSPPPATQKARPRVVEVETRGWRPQTQTWGLARSAPRDAPPSRSAPRESTPSQRLPEPPAPVLGEPKSKKDLVLAFPRETPAAEIVAAAARRGVTLSMSYVYLVRSRARAEPNEPAPVEEHGLEAARKAVERELSRLTPADRRRLLRELLDEAGRKPR